MKINTLKLNNFRCFQSLEIKLHPQCNIFIGVNGAGKTTILDAIAIALGGYLSGFDDMRSNYIQKEDAHLKMFPIGSRIDAQPQFPVTVYAEGTVHDSEAALQWQRELNGLGRRTTHVNAKEIAAYAAGLQEQVRIGAADCILPIVAYYSTGRLWLQKRNRTPHKRGEKLNRQMGYIDCIAAESNEKQMLQWFEDMTYIQLQEGQPVIELETVKQALRQCYMSMDESILDAQFRYNVKSQELEITVYRQETAETFPIRMLSDGEKGVISLVADIAYRMALLNPNLLDHVLETPGVVLIDEIDMHLHPAWQKKLLKNLMNTFPNVQFVVTTHSPSVLANASVECIQLLDQYRLRCPQDTTYGRTAEEILNQVMGINIRPAEVLELQRQFDEAIDAEDYTAAQEILNRQRALLGNNAQNVIENQITLDVETL